MKLLLEHIRSWREQRHHDYIAQERQRLALETAQRLIRELARLGFKTEPTRRKQRSRRVEFETPLLLTPDELWCPVDLSTLPERRSTAALRADDTLCSLSDRVHMPVRIDTLATGKLCIVVRLRAQQFPTKISLSTIAMPSNTPPLAFPLGVDGESGLGIADLAQIKHLLVAGATGGGKSTFVHCMLQTFVARNSAASLDLRLIDLKGQELTRYSRLGGDRGVVSTTADTPAAALDVLTSAVKEIERRNSMLQRADCNDLAELARVASVHLPRVVVVVDELALLTLNRDKIGQHTVGNWAQFLINQIASLGRASGVHCVIATQHINTDVLSALTLANFETRIAFSTADWRKSQTLIETSEADGLPVGRMIYRHQGRTRMYQAPLVTSQQIRLEISRIARGGPNSDLDVGKETALFVKDAKLLLTVACNAFDGNVSRRKITDHPDVRGVISHHRFNEIAVRLERDGVLEIHGRQRRVVRAFYSNIDLIDSMYMPKTSPEPSPEPSLGSGDMVQLVHAHCDAANDGSEMVHGSPESGSMPAVTLDLFGAFITTLGGGVPAAAPAPPDNAAGMDA